MLRRLLSRVWVLAVAAAILSGCAAQRLIREGDKLLEQSEYARAIEQYEEALRVAPGHDKAHERIRMARRQAVRAQLERADRSLTAGKLATALRHALRARRMPLDLEDVDLVKRIDATIAKSASLAEARVDDLVKRGYFVQAVRLSREIVRASPGVTSRERWGANVQARAQQHYASLAASLREKGLHGSAAMQLAFAQAVGSTVAIDAVQEEWNRFAEPFCFAKPTLDIIDESGKAKELVAKLETTAQAELARLTDRCGEGRRELGVRIDLVKVSAKDKTKRKRGAKPLPGVEIKIEEVYYEEVPYTEVEQYTEYETRIEKQERRDCAPRPGKPRGCRTWVEDVEVTIPRKKTRAVQKVRRVRKTRPMRDPLPEDKVVSYDVTHVARAVLVEGTMTLTGAATAEREFSVLKTSEDQGNARIEAREVVVEADPLEVKTMAALIAEAAEAITGEIERGLTTTVRAWAEAYEKEAHKQVVSGQLPQAEELYLKLLALGAGGSASMAAFFKQRYGEPVNDVIKLLAAALGRQVAGRDERSGPDREKGVFPRRAPSRPGGRAQPEPAREADVAAPEAAAIEQEKSAVSAAEIEALEAASMAAFEETPARGQTDGAAPDGDATAAQSAGEAERETEGATEDQAENQIDEEPEKPQEERTRRPIAPPT